MNIDGTALRKRLESVGCHLSICHNYYDKIKMAKCKTDKELKQTVEEINHSIHQVHIANLAINHSNYSYDEKVLGKLGEKKG